MNFSRKKRPLPEISMTSMVDVVLLLLFFFMVSTTFNRQTEVKINLPEADGAAAEQHPESVVLTIDVEGNYFLKGKDGLPHELVNSKTATLIQAFKESTSVHDQTPFIIDADSKASHQAVIKALDAAGKAGFTHISFSGLKTDDEK
jgi:biopolymer transport protein ExbD